MSAAKDGGPAFPTHVGRSAEEAGMTLRDHFAGQAMQAWLSSFDGETPHPGAAIDGDKPGAVKRLGGLAMMSYMVADAMLAEREKVQP